ncbi:hypothetical protein NDN08_002756 [Rhodosorus marinus]|uniref:Transmembrane protein 107 n=1 Tax=Rhodosorus marinus TaxID=101924 RepID=A0AAV8UYP0_9RHOD|nr:hypothetical protein NDN08_002756 [Rhodosorus marinus]
MGAMLNFPETMFAYGMLCAIVGGMEVGGNEAGPLYPLFGRLVVAALCVGVSAVTRNTSLKKGEEGYKGMMAGIHIGILIPVLYAVVAALRLVYEYDPLEKSNLLPFLIWDIGVSVLAFASALSQKPKKTKSPQAEKPALGAMTTRSFFGKRTPAASPAHSNTSEFKPSQDKKKD